MIGTGLEAYINIGAAVTPLTAKEYFVGYVAADKTIQDALNAFNLTVPQSQVYVLSFGIYNPPTSNYIVRKFFCPLAAGATYAPLGQHTSEKDLIIIDTIYPNEQTMQSAVTAINAELFNVAIADITQLISQLNATGPWDLSDVSKIFYWKVTTASNEYVYILSEASVRGVYGTGQAYQFTDADLILFYSNETGTITQPAIQKNEMQEKVITSAVDVNNLDVQGKNFLTFTQAISVTGIKSSNLYDGQKIIVKNISEGLLFIKFLSSESSASNRIYIVGEKDLSLKPGTCAELVYSKLRNRLETINVFGTDFMPTMIYGGAKNRAVLSTPDGIVTPEEIGEFWKLNETPVAYNTLAAIVADYPSNAANYKGLVVVTPFTTPPAIYHKCSDGDTFWLKHTTAGLTLLT